MHTEMDCISISRHRLSYRVGPALDSVPIKQHDSLWSNYSDEHISVIIFLKITRRHYSISSPKILQNKNFKRMPELALSSKFLLCPYSNRVSRATAWKKMNYLYSSWEITLVLKASDDCVVQRISCMPTATLQKWSRDNRIGWFTRMIYMVSASNNCPLPNINFKENLVLRILRQSNPNSTHLISFVLKRWCEKVTSGAKLL